MTQRVSDMRTWTLETGLNIWYTVNILFYKIIVPLRTKKLKLKMDGTACGLY